MNGPRTIRGGLLPLGPLDTYNGVAVSRFCGPCRDALARYENRLQPDVTLCAACSSLMQVGALPTVVVEVEAPPPRPAIAVRVETLVVPGASPPLAAWTVVVCLPRGEWRETFGDEGNLQAFLRGARAAGASLGYAVEVEQ